ETGTIDGPGGNPADDLGDGGPATSATFSDPTGISFDSDGSLLVADQGNNVIRRIAVGGDGKLTPTSVITTIAGDGRPTYAGDGGLPRRDAGARRAGEARRALQGRRPDVRRRFHGRTLHVHRRVVLQQQRPASQVLRVGCRPLRAPRRDGAALRRTHPRGRGD